MYHGAVLQHFQQLTILNVHMRTPKLKTCARCPGPGWFTKIYSSPLYIQELKQSQKPYAKVKMWHTVMRAVARSLAIIGKMQYFSLSAIRGMGTKHFFLEPLVWTDAT